MNSNNKKPAGVWASKDELIVGYIRTKIGREIPTASFRDVESAAIAVVLGLRGEGFLPQK